MFNFKSREIEIAQQNRWIQAEGSAKNRESSRDEVSESAVRNKLVQIQNQRTSDPLNTGFPINEVIESISVEQPSNQFQGGFASYWRLARAAKDGSLPGEGSTDFLNLRNACAEAIIYQGLREAPGRGQAPASTVTVFDPVGKSRTLAAMLPDFFKPFTNDIIASVGSKTPDVLLVSAPFTYSVPSGTITDHPSWPDIVDLNDPTASRTKSQPYIGKTVISPIEITTSTNYKLMKEKIEKFQTYTNPFKKSGLTFVPILVLDRQAFLDQRQKDRVKLVKSIEKIGGHIQLVNNMTNDATKKAKKIAPELVNAVAIASQKSKGLGSKFSTGLKSLSGQLIATPTAWMKKVSHNFFPSNGSQTKTNETSEPNAVDTASPQVEKASSKQQNATEIYRKLVSSATSIAPQLQKVGLDVINNSDHLNIMIAVKTIKSGLDPDEILKQSPTYLAQGSPIGDVWIMNIVGDARNLITENSFSSPVSKKILQFYDRKDLTSQPNPQKQKSVNDFDQIAASVKEHNLQLNKIGLKVLENREHLHIVVSAVATSSGLDAETILRQSPDYLSATPKEGAALLSDWQNKAKSTFETVESAPVKVADRGGFER